MVCHPLENSFRRTPLPLGNYCRWIPPLPLGISNDLLWGGGGNGYFLEPHIWSCAKFKGFYTGYFFYFSNTVMMYIFSEGIGPRTSSRGTSSMDSAATSNAVGSGKATLRLRSKGPPLVETEEVSYHLRLLFIWCSIEVLVLLKNISQNIIQGGAYNIVQRQFKDNL